MKTFIGFKEAFNLTLSNVPTAGTETLPLNRLAGKILSEDIDSKADSPSANTSLRDGYAVISEDLEGASRQNPKKLKVVGNITAGKLSGLSISRGQAVRITTGAPIPKGASAVLSDEFCQPTEDDILCVKVAAPGQNVLRQGTDVRQGETVAREGEKLSPALIGLMASAGLEEAKVYKSPCVSVIATGDEVVAPGSLLPEGKLYASNMVEICSWLYLCGLSCRAELVCDRKGNIEAAISKHLPYVDAFITSGGAWGSERDLILSVLEDLKWQGIYHRVRMGPGKAIGFGLLEKKPFFCLPGSPPSNETAFLQLAFPGLMAMGGDHHLLFPVVRAQLTETVRGDKDWTQFLDAQLSRREDHLLVRPSRQKSRLQTMARRDAFITIPEGRGELERGEGIDVQLLMPLTQRLGISQGP